MKVVLDTNVFVSGIFFNGLPYEILKAWQNHRIELIISIDILTEYQRVGDIMKEDHPAIDLKPIIEYVIQNATVYDAAPLASTVCEDPDDDKFLACALASDASVIVSGDKHLLKVSGYQGIEVIKPRDFINRYLLELDRSD